MKVDVNFGLSSDSSQDWTCLILPAFWITRDHGECTIALGWLFFLMTIDIGCFEV